MFEGAVATDIMVISRSLGGMIGTPIHTTCEKVYHSSRSTEKYGDARKRRPFLLEFYSKIEQKYTFSLFRITSSILTNLVSQTHDK
jgi:hypothetical protein